MSDHMARARKDIALGFDGHASTYDDEMARQHSVIDRFRRIHRQTYERVFAPGSTILEVGCGTGEESLALAAMGHRVLAVDPSGEMLARLEAKRRVRGFQSAISLHQGAGPSFIRTLLEKEGGADGVVSALGPLNCEADLKELASAIAPFLRPGAGLVLSPMARFCPWEIFALSVQGHLFEAWRRFKRPPVRVEVSGREIPVWYRSSQTICRAFAPSFTRVYQRALGLFLPPPYLAAQGASPIWYEWAERLEDRLASRAPFHHFGDHLLMVFVRLRGDQ